MLVAGSRLLPRLLGIIARLRSRELFVIAVAVIAIGTASAAELLGVSVALGAFVAGLALAESDLSASVLGEIVPLRELFSTFFFVSIGVLLQPDAILAAWPIVLTLLLVITLGKALPIAGLAHLGGLPASSSLRTGALIGQSGEFSFVLASTGLQSRRRPAGGIQPRHGCRRRLDSHSRSPLRGIPSGRGMGGFPRRPTAAAGR